MRKPPAHAMAPFRSPVGAIVVFGLGLLLLAAAAVGLAAGSGTSADPPATKATPSKPASTTRDGGNGKAGLAPSGPLATATTTTSTPPDPNLVPVAIRIPAIGVSSPLISLGLNPDQTLEVPRDFQVAGWYRYRPVPGNPGPSVIAGHVDSRVGPAVFFRLGDLHPGATIDVERNDGSIAEFTVTALEEHPKDAFPTERVYGPTVGAQLRVITCGGSFDWSTRHYRDNLIAFATLSHIIPG